MMNPPKTWDGGKIAVFYAAVFLIAGSYMAYLPVWLKWRGLSETQITLIFALPLIMRIFLTPVLSFVADRTGKRRALVFWLSQGSLAALLLLPLSTSHTVILASLTLYALLWTSVIPLTETLAVAAVKRGGLTYGQMRLWGSLSFIVAVAVGGVVVDLWGPAAALWVVIASSASVAVAARFLPERNGKAGAANGAGPAPVRLRDAGRLAGAPCFVLFLIAAAAVNASHAVYNTLATLHWLSLGIDVRIIGILWATGVIAEIALFGYSARVAGRLSPPALMAIAAAAAVLRWAAMVYNPPLYVLFPVQMLHALTFGAAHLGAIHFLSQAVPERYAATGQGLYAAVAAGLGMGAASIAAGPLYKAFNAGAFFVMAGLAAVSLLFAVLLAWRWDGKTVLPGEPADEPVAGPPYPHNPLSGGSITPAR